MWNENIKANGGVMTTSFLESFTLDIIGQVLKNNYNIIKK